MDLARAPRRRPLTARKKGSGYENAPCRAPLTARKMGSGYENESQSRGHRGYTTVATVAKLSEG